MIKDDDGNVIELRCSYDPDTRSGTGTSDRKVEGTIHWVSAAHAIDAKVRLYDRLFTIVNPNMATLDSDTTVQFERLGYFRPDSEDDTAGSRVFNRVVTLRDSWAKIEKQAMQSMS